MSHPPVMIGAVLAQDLDGRNGSGSGGSCFGPTELN